MTEMWSEEKEKEVLDYLKTLEDFASFPLPNHWYKKYDIEPPKPQTFKDFANSGYWLKRHFDPTVEREIRTEPVPGGVRPVLEQDVIPVEVITKTVSDNQPETQKMLEDSKESNDSTPQQ